jgi:hypothetical protein
MFLTLTDQYSYLHNYCYGPWLGPVMTKRSTLLATWPWPRVCAVAALPEHVPQNSRNVDGSTVGHIREISNDFCLLI